MEKTKMTIIVNEENKKAFTTKVKTELEKICDDLADLEIFETMNEDADREHFTVQRVLYDAYKMLGYELARMRKYVYSMIFKGKLYYLDTLTMTVREKGAF
jgi:hypothetical protein